MCCEFQFFTKNLSHTPLTLANSVEPWSNPKTLQSQLKFCLPVVDELTSKISTLNLERVRRLKSRLVAMTRRVQKVRDEIKQLMDDDDDMAEMYF
ncbi:magnesium transporter [Trifolium repens]|nr:magnesium transporter [Trifolium repens]